MSGLSPSARRAFRGGAQASFSEKPASDRAYQYHRKTANYLKRVILVQEITALSREILMIDSQSRLFEVLQKIKNHELEIQYKNGCTLSTLILLFN